MPLVNFQPRFAHLVERGEKRQTIRAMRKDGRDPKPGDTLYLYTGCRTKQARKLGMAKCVSVEPIRIRMLRGMTAIAVKRYLDTNRAPRRRVWVELDLAEAQALARADGLDSLLDLRRWFDRVHGLPFEGILIRWQLK